MCKALKRGRIQNLFSVKSLFSEFFDVQLLSVGTMKVYAHLKFRSLRKSSVSLMNSNITKNFSKLDHAVRKVLIG